MGDKKEKSKSSGMGGILTIVIFLWLAGLTALTVMFLKGSGSTDVEERLMRLEAKAASVGRKVDPAQGRQLADLEVRLGKLEQQFGGAVLSASTSDAAAGVSNASACNCDELTDRVEKLETMVTAMAPSDAPRSMTVAATEEPPKEVKEDKSVEPKKAAPRKAVAPKPKKTAKKRVAKKKSTAGAVAPAYPGGDSNAYYTRYDPAYGGESVFDMTQRIDPNYTRSEYEQTNVNKLAPGAAIYPDSGAYLSE